jgi:hypothetical protein
MSISRIQGVKRLGCLPCPAKCSISILYESTIQMGLRYAFLGTNLWQENMRMNRRYESGRRTVATNTFVMILVLFLFSPAYAKDWVKVISEIGQFSIEFPSNPKIIPAFFRGKSIDRIYYVESKQQALMASFTDARKFAMVGKTESKIFNYIQRVGVKKSNGTLIESKSISHAGLRGRQFRFRTIDSNAPMITTMRVFLRKEIIYKLIHVTSPMNADNPIAERFFNSFNLLKPR